MRNHIEQQPNAHQFNLLPPELKGVKEKPKLKKHRLGKSIAALGLAGALSTPAISSAEAVVPNPSNTVIGLSNPDKWLPLDITEPSGKVYDGEVKAYLGLLAEVQTPQYVLDIYKTKIIAVEEISTDFQGSPNNIYLLDVVIGKYEDGSPCIIRGMIGRKNEVFYFDNINYLKNYQSSSSGDHYSNFGVSPELIERFILLSNANTEIAIQVPSNFDQSLINNYLNSPDPNTQRIGELFQEGFEHNDYNLVIRQALSEAETDKFSTPIISNVYKDVFNTESYGFFWGSVVFQSDISNQDFLNNMCILQITKPC